VGLLGFPAIALCLSASFSIKSPATALFSFVHLFSLQPPLVIPAGFGLLAFIGLSSIALFPKVYRKKAGFFPAARIPLVFWPAFAIFSRSVCGHISPRFLLLLLCAPIVTPGGHRFLTSS
jgi:hypothetical protein